MFEKRDSMALVRAGVPSKLQIKPILVVVKINGAAVKSYNSYSNCKKTTHFLGFYRKAWWLRFV